MESIAELDRSLTLAINSWHYPFTDAVWQFFSHVQIWYIMYIIIVIMLFVKLGTKRALIVTASLLLFIIASDQLANLVKHAVCRLRPMEDADMIARGLRALEAHGGLYGFYSGHAANAMGFAVCSAMGFRNDPVGRRYRTYTVCITLWAVLVGLSRVFVGKHFLGDVLAGFAAGRLTGWIFGKLAQIVIRKLYVIKNPDVASES